MTRRLSFALGLALACMAVPVASAADDPAQPGLAARLHAIDVDPGRNTLAAYERLQARQALDAMANARPRDRAAAAEVARLRVETAEIAVATEAARAELGRLERERSELLVEASRQDAARARQEAERLRIQAQIQAEESARLRLAAQEETLARQEAETILDDVAGAQAAKLRAARQREAELARREAELLREVPEESATP